MALFLVPFRMFILIQHQPAINVLNRNACNWMPLLPESDWCRDTGHPAQWARLLPIDSPQRPPARWRSSPPHLQQWNQIAFTFYAHNHCARLFHCRLFISIKTSEESLITYGWNRPHQVAPNPAHVRCWRARSSRDPACRGLRVATTRACCPQLCCNMTYENGSRDEAYQRDVIRLRPRYLKVSRQSLQAQQIAESALIESDFGTYSSISNKSTSSASELLANQLSRSSEKNDELFLEPIHRSPLSTLEKMCSRHTSKSFTSKGSRLSCLTCAVTIVVAPLIVLPAMECCLQYAQILAVNNKEETRGVAAVSHWARRRKKKC